MVATSVIARGLDVPRIVLVINYSCPNHMEDYVHRIGNYFFLCIICNFNRKNWKSRELGHSDYFYITQRVGNGTRNNQGDGT